MSFVKIEIPKGILYLANEEYANGIRRGISADSALMRCRKCDTQFVIEVAK